MTDDEKAVEDDTESEVQREVLQYFFRINRAAISAMHSPQAQQEYNLRMIVLQIFYLSFEKQEITREDLYNFALIKHSQTLKKYLDILVEDGLLRAAPNPQDRRQLLYKPTDLFKYISAVAVKTILSQDFHHIIDITKILDDSRTIGIYQDLIHHEINQNVSMSVYGDIIGKYYDIMTMSLR